MAPPFRALHSVKLDVFILVLSPAIYIAPPSFVAECLLNVESVTEVFFPPIYIAPPFMLVENPKLEPVMFVLSPSIYIDPPFALEALLYVRLDLMI